MTMDEILTSAEVSSVARYSRRHLYRLEQRGDFPGRIKLGAKKVGWLKKDIEEWIRSRPKAGANVGNVSSK